MSAKEMFKELGYELIVSDINDNYNYIFIKYEHKVSEYESEYIDTIKFMNDEIFHEKIILERKLNGYEDSLELSKYVIKAIQQQITELGWESNK